VETPGLQHWIVTVARASGLPGAEGLSVPSGTSLERAWEDTARATGVTAEALAGFVARHYRLRVADLGSVDPHAERLLPARFARRLGVVPLRHSDRILVVGTADPARVESEAEIAQVAGRGVHFEVAPPATVAEALSRAYPEGGVDGPQAPSPGAGGTEGPRILVVDDESDMRELLRHVLETKGFRVTEAAGGAEALERLAGDEPFALVTLDLKMDEMPGLEVLRQIRSRARTAALPVIVTTGSDDPAAEMALFEAGADDFVVKPVDPPRYLLRVQAVLRRRESSALDGSLGLT
jgi:CheY-like chemotaxis protein